MEKPQGTLPSNIEANPREHMKAISLRNGKAIEERAAQGPSAEMKRAVVQEGPSAIEEPIKESDQRDERELDNPILIRPTIQEYRAQVPYPTRLKTDKEDEQFKKFMDIFKQLHINILLVEALSQMPKKQEETGKGRNSSS